MLYVYIFTDMRFLRCILDPETKKLMYTSMKGKELIKCVISNRTNGKAYFLNVNLVIKKGRQRKMRSSCVCIIMYNHLGYSESPRTTWSKRCFEMFIHDCFVWKKDIVSENRSVKQNVYIFVGVLLTWVLMTSSL